MSDTTDNGNTRDRKVTTDTVEVRTLTAELHTVTVTSRQVTRSMLRQLDHTPPAEIEPWGRVQGEHPLRGVPHGLVEAVSVVGRHRVTGQLVRSSTLKIQGQEALYSAWRGLPLIVLAR